MLKIFSISIALAALPSFASAESLVGNWICKVVDNVGDGLIVTRLADMEIRANGILSAKLKFVFEDTDLSATAFAIYRGKWSYKDGMLYEEPLRAKVTKLTENGRNKTRSKFAQNIRRSMMTPDVEPLAVTFKSTDRILIDHGNAKENCQRKK